MKKYLYTSFDIRKLGVVDKDAKNILITSPPYYLFGRSGADITRNIVLVLGDNFKKFPFPDDEQECIDVFNKCLDFVRRECVDCKLYYKPHPTSLDNDAGIYDLRSFEILKDRTAAEIFFYENFNQIKHVFSPCSLASLSAYGLGLNSHVFFRLLKTSWGELGRAYFKSYLEGMPESYFISDLDQPLKENKKLLEKDVFFENHLAKQLDENPGTVWFTIVDPACLQSVLVISKLIKKLSPNRKVGLLIMRHERWNSINMDRIMKHFDNFSFFPKVSYALKLTNLLNAFKTTVAVKRFKIKPGDIICGMDMGSFLENCFISYFKKNLSIQITTDQLFNFTHHFEAPPDLSDFNVKWTTLFLNYIFVSVLGLHGSIRLYRPSRKNGGQFTRYREAINKVFDVVYIFKHT